MDKILDLQDSNIKLDLGSGDLFNRIAYQKWAGIAKKHYDCLTQDYPDLEQRAYQWQYAAMYCVRRYNICGGSPGLGKTILSGISIATIYDNMSSRRPGSIQIVVPNALSANTRWLPDLNKIAALKDCVEFINSEKQVVTSTKPIWLYTFDFLKRKSANLKSTTRPYMSRWIKKNHRIPAFIVIDECHNLKSNTDRTRHLAYIAFRSKRRLALSGTLTDGRLDLMQHLCSMIYGKFFPYSRKLFESQFGYKKELTSNYISGDEEDSQTQKRYMQSLAAHKVPAYFKTVTQYVHRVTLADPDVLSCVKLPISRDRLVSVEMSQAHADLYRNTIATHREQLRLALQYNTSASYRSKAFSILRPLLIACNCPWVLGLEEVPIKVQVVSDLVHQGWKENRKTSIFVNFIESGRYLHDHFSRLYGESAVERIYAIDINAQKQKQLPEERELSLNRFLFDPQVKVGIFSINLCSESIDLTSAGAICYYETCWQALRIQQSINRCVRPGSIHDNIDVSYVTNANTIDVHMYNLLAEKLKAAKRLLDFELDELEDMSLKNGTIKPEELISRVLNEQ